MADAQDARLRQVEAQLAAQEARVRALEQALQRRLAEDATRRDYFDELHRKWTAQGTTLARLREALREAALSAQGLLVGVHGEEHLLDMDDAVMSDECPKCQANRATIAQWLALADGAEDEAAMVPARE